VRLYVVRKRKGRAMERLWLIEYDGTVFRTPSQAQSGTKAGFFPGWMAVVIAGLVGVVSLVAWYESARTPPQPAAPAVQCIPPAPPVNPRF
jgi:hypothetical protein